MKKYTFIYMILAALLIGLTGCKKDMELYSHPQNCINILDTLFRYSFVYTPSGTTQDTVWVRIETVGFVTANNRPVAFEQINSGGRDAAAGVHYIAFDNSDVQKHYVILGNSVATTIPVVLKRDPSLEQEDYTLLFQVKETDYFGRGFVGLWTCRVVISDRLIRPDSWIYRTITDFGEYGPVKHRWLIEHTGNKWDDEYLRDVLGYEYHPVNPTINANYDEGYMAYYRLVLQNMLNEYNELNKTILMEEDGTPVTFI